MSSKNRLYYGDNLDVLRRYVKDESVDLIYLDPPFNSRQDYNVLFAEKDGTRSSSQIMAFEDTWEWNIDAEKAYQEIVEAGGRVSDVMRAFRTFLGHSDMMAYLAMMAPRLIELRRVLKITGSIYLHCDPTASHYLKMLMDAIFGPQYFRNEITWKRSDAHSDAKQGAKHYGRIHDVILFYSKGSSPKFRSIYRPLSDTTADNWYRYVEEGTGRRYNKADVTGPGGAAKGNAHYEWKGVTRYWRYSEKTMAELEAEGRLVYSKSGMVYEKRYLDESKGVSVQDWWDDISMLRGLQRNGERLGYQQLQLVNRHRVNIGKAFEALMVAQPSPDAKNALAAIAAKQMVDFGPNSLTGKDDQPNEISPIMSVVKTVVEKQSSP